MYYFTLAIFGCVLTRTVHSQNADIAFREIQDDETLQQRLLAENRAFCTEHGGCDMRSSNTTETCCAPCHCDDECRTYGDCCLDRFILNPTGRHKGLICLKTTFKVRDKSDDVKHYYMVGLCPASFKDKEVVNKCESDSEGDVNLNRPVTSLENSMTYRNKYCAICNNIETFTPWLFRVNCSNTVAFSERKSPEDLLRAAISEVQCDVFVEPGVSLPVRRCTAPQVTSCNVTGNWVDYDKFLELACRAYSNPFSHRELILGPMVVYRNVFCYQCNMNDTPGLSTPSSCRAIKRNVPFTITVPFSALLDFNPSTSVANTTDGDVNSGCHCDPGGVYDIILGCCHALLCSAGRTLSGYQCVPIVRRAFGLAYELIVSLKSTKNTRISKGDWAQSVFEHFGKLFHKLDIYVDKLFSTIKLNISFDDMLHGSFPEQLTGTLHELTVYYTFIVMNEVNMNDIEDILMSAITNNWRLVNGDEVLELSISDVKQGKWDTNQYQTNIGSHRLETTEDGGFLNTITYQYYRPIQFPSLKVYASANDYIRVSHVLKCPHVKINDTEYNITNVSGLGAYGLSINKSGYDENTDAPVFVCLSSVSDRFLTNDAASYMYACLAQVGDSFALVEGYLSLVCSVVSIICLAFTLITYGLFETLRTLPGRNNMCLVGMLLLAQALFQFGVGLGDFILVCRVVAVVIHYLWLSTFCWMNMCSFHMFRVFSTFNGKDIKFNEFRRFITYILYSYLCPIPVIVIAAVANYLTSSDHDIGYGGAICYMNNPLTIGLAFALPLGLILVANGFFLTFTIITIQRIPKINKSSRKQNHHNVFVYLKLSTLTGVLWVVGFIAIASQSIVLRYIFTVLNAGEGVLLLISYVLNRRVYKLYKDRLQKLFGRTRGMGHVDSSSSNGVSSSGQSRTVVSHNGNDSATTSLTTTKI